MLSKNNNKNQKTRAQRLEAGGSEPRCSVSRAKCQRWTPRRWHRRCARTCSPPYGTSSSTWPAASRPFHPKDTGQRRKMGPHMWMQDMKGPVTVSTQPRNGPRKMGETLRLNAHTTSTCWEQVWSWYLTFVAETENYLGNMKDVSYACDIQPPWTLV